MNTDSYKYIFDLSPEAIVVLDSKTRIVDINPAGLNYLGYTKAEIVGKTLVSAPFISLQSKVVVVKKFAERMLGLKVDPYEIGFNRKDGKKIIALVRGAIIKDKKGKIVNDLVVLSDVTESRLGQHEFKAIIEASPNTIISTDLDFVITFASKNSYKMFSPDNNQGSFQGKKILDFIANSDSEKIKSLADQILKSKNENNDNQLEVVAIDINKNSFYALISIGLVRDDNNNPIGFIFILRDITSEKKDDDLNKKLYSELKNRLSTIGSQNQRLEDTKIAMLNLLEDSKVLEEELRKSQDSLTKAQEIAHLGNWDWDMVSNKLYWSDEIYRIFGFKPQSFSLTYDKFLSFVHTDDREKVRTAVNEALIESNGKEYEIEHKTVLPDKQIKYVLEKGEVVFESSKPIRMIGTVLDITKVKLLEIELREEKKSVETKVVERTAELNDEKSKLAASIEALAKAFVMIDTAGNVILTNENLNKIFNDNKKSWKLDEIQTKFGSSFDFVKAYKTILTDSKRAEYNDIEIGPKYYQVRLSPVYSGPEGQRTIGGILAIIGDVTEEKILERSRDEFFSIASHELRTPLTAIRGNTSMILDYYKEQIKDPELKLMITDMHDASLRLIGIVNDFLDLSRLEQGRMEFKLIKTKLSEIVTNVVTDLEITAKEKGIKLEANISDNIMVNIDPDKIKQVLFNIAGNSIKFTEKGGVTIASEIKDNFAIVRVTDTGLGIPLANQALLFHKFQQASSSTITRDGAKGTGLGLYISKLMVEGMGGKIGLESSTEGKGSVFMFTLPIAKT